MKYTQKWMVVPYTATKQDPTDINENLQQILQKSQVPEDKKVKEYNQLLAKQVLQTHPIVPVIPEPKQTDTQDTEVKSDMDPSNIRQDLKLFKNDLYDYIVDSLESHREEIVDTIIDRLKEQPRVNINRSVNKAISELDKSRIESSFDSSKIAHHTRSKAKKKTQALDSIRNLSKQWEAFH